MIKAKVSEFLNKLDVLFFIGAGFVVVFSTYHIFFAERIIPGVVIAGVDLGGKTAEEALVALNKAEDRVDKNLRFVYDKKVYEIKAPDISLEYDWPANVKRAFEVGRTGNFLVDSKDKIAGLIKPLKIRALYSFDGNALNKVFSEMRGELNIDGRNAGFSLENGDLVIIESSDGLKINDQKLYELAVSSFDHLDFSTKSIPLISTRARVKAEDLRGIKDEVRSLVFNQISIVGGDEKVKIYLTPQQKLEFLKFEKKLVGGAEVSFDKKVFEDYARTLFLQVNKLPRGKVTRTDGQRVVGFEIMERGESLDINAFTKNFKEAFFSKKDSVSLIMKRNDNNVPSESYGIFALLGEGKSKFNGSIPGRINNLTLAAQRTSGVLVPPGDIYSFNASVGEISATTGYDTAYIISNGRTVLGEGGGVCQTSTTLFRAILNAGLPIVERHPHAYRVGYYEIDSPVGIDASVYQPSLDLRFKNDTPNYVLIEAVWDLQEQSLTFRIYGTPDGRKVEMTEPVVTNQSAPPAPLYEDDASLPKGTTWQVDFAAWGAQVSFKRTVTKGGKILYEDTFASSYQPWRAIYKVGTGG